MYTKIPKPARDFGIFCTYLDEYQIIFVPLQANQVFIYMYAGDIDTIADKGISPDEVTDAVQLIAQETIGINGAIWRAIHNDRRKLFRRMQAIAVIAVLALCVSLILLFRITLS